jgi:hypothetical protein
VAILLIRDYRETTLRILRHTFLWRCWRHFGRINVIVELKPLPSSISNLSSRISSQIGKPKVSTGLTGYMTNVVDGNSWGGMVNTQQQKKVGFNKAIFDNHRFS